MAERWSQESTVGLLLIGLIAVFAITGTNFATAGNAAELGREAAVVGLIALGLTPVILAGGIDLSVAGMVGLASVALGLLWRDVGLPVWIAAVGAVACGAAGGLLNGVLVTRLRLPALIVTLGTWSLYRGLAEGLTRGVDNVTGFPGEFLVLGQGYLGGAVPVQVPLVALIAAALWLALHRMPWGRELRAIGFAPEGARHAGIQVERRLLAAYVLCGALAGLAAVVSVSQVGQAKADAGLGLELVAITAVVLGGTSIFGGIGSIHGTVLGLAAIVVMRNGLRLSDGPAELAGILTGILLVAAIALRPILERLSRPLAVKPPH